MMLTTVGCWDLRGSKGIFKNCTWAQKKVHKITSLCLWVPPIKQPAKPKYLRRKQGRGRGKRRSWLWRANESIRPILDSLAYNRGQGATSCLCMTLGRSLNNLLPPLANILPRCYEKSTQPRNLRLTKGLGEEKDKGGKRKNGETERIQRKLTPPESSRFLLFLILSPISSQWKLYFLSSFCFAPVHILTRNTNQAQFVSLLLTSLNHIR